MYPIDKIKEGTRFIDVDKDFDEIKLIVATSNPTNKKLSAFWYNFPDEPTIIELEDFKGSAFPDLKSSSTEIFGRFLDLEKIYSISYKAIEDIIYINPLKKVDVEVILDFYKNNYNLKENEAEALIKLSVSKGLLSFERQSKGKFIKLSAFALEYENKKRFLEGIADEIISKSQRIELLIQHNPVKGNYREELLRGILKKYLPKKYEVATGFVEGCKRQCDILIYDSQNFSPLFREGDLVVIPEKALRAVIEVKSTLDSNQFNDGMDLLWEVARNTNTPAPIFKGIFAFNKGYSSESTISEAICNFYHSKDKSGILTKDIMYLFETLNSVCVLNQQCIITDLIDYKMVDDTIRPRFYSVHSENENLKLYCASFFNELFSFLDVDKHAKKVNINYFRSFDYEIKYKLEAELHNKDWIPQSCFQNEHHFNSDSIWERTSDVLNWKVGNYNIQNLEEKYFSSSFQVEDYKKRFLDKNI